MKRTSHVAALTLLSLVTAPAWHPVADDSASPRLMQELQGIRQALEKLVALREIDQRGRSIDLLFRRIELRERRLKPLEDRLRQAESNMERLESSVNSLNRMQEQHDERLDAEIREGVDTPRSDTRRKLDNIKASQESQAERLKGVRIRIQELENDLARGRDELLILEERLLEILEEEEL